MVVDPWFGRSSCTRLTCGCTSAVLLECERPATQLTSLIFSLAFLDLSSYLQYYLIFMLKPCMFLALSAVFSFFCESVDTMPRHVVSHTCELSVLIHLTSRRLTGGDFLAAHDPCNAWWCPGCSEVLFTVVVSFLYCLRGLVTSHCPFFLPFLWVFPRYYYSFFSEITIKLLHSENKSDWGFY